MSIAEIKSQICDDYCKFPVVYNLDQDSLSKICEKCPLNDLHEPLVMKKLNDWNFNFYRGETE